MIASAERTAARPVPEALPPALSSMWRLCRLGYRHEPGLLVAAFLLSLAAALPDALLALWLALLGRGVLEGDRERVFERFTRLDDARARIEHCGFVTDRQATWLAPATSTRSWPARAAS